MSDRAVRVAAVGLGRWAKVLADAAGKSDRLKIVNCFSRSEKNREAFSRQYGCRAAKSYAELLSDPEVEGVVVTTPNDAHAQPILEAAGKGKHVYVDKPIAHTMADARLIDQACSDAGVVLAVGHGARRLQGNRKIKEILDRGGVGKLVMAECNFSNNRSLDLTPEQWRWYKDKSPGGPLIQLGVHHTDTLNYLFGPAKRVTAMVKRLYTPAEIEDVTMTLIEMESGQLCYAGSNWASQGAFYTYVYGMDANLFFTVDLDFWQRSDTVDQHSRLEMQRRGSSEHQSIPLARGDILREELEEFAGCVREKKRPEVGGPEGIAALAVVHAAIRSAATGRTVEIKEVMSGEA
ncbi:MAG: Gfo/Idh/MocA family oxidoreductase [Deltaproteobacteria bacterium]|nr:Gfo/Idh/MocA family oxidoreductase [Deltaproteobacteria bacterium]